MRFPFLALVAALLLVPAGAALAVEKPGWATAVGPRATGPYMDFALQGIGDGRFPWQLSYLAPCNGENKGTSDEASFTTADTPGPAPIRVRHGRFQRRLTLVVGDRHIEWTISGHRSGKIVVGTFRAHVVFTQPGTKVAESVCDTGVLHWKAHRDRFSI